MQSSHSHRPTAAYIDLDGLAENFINTKRFVGDGLMYLAVVKANAYGHGAARCSLRLETEGADWFGVVLPEEGADLRTAGISKPILCMGSFWPGQESMVLENNLVPVIYDMKAAFVLNKEAARRDRIADIHVKIDTGMGRVGICHQDSSRFAHDLLALSNLCVTGLMTHFAAAEDPGETDFTLQQIERFSASCDAFRGAGHDPKFIDMANSPAAIGHAASRGNMVRLGGILYGLLDDILHPSAVRPLTRPVMTLKSRIANIKRVPEGESLGYGRTFVTARDSLIGLVPVGYADGYPRSLSNRGKMRVRGQLVPVVGRISMDWTLIDVTDVPAVAAGDEAVIIGEGVSAADIAGVAGTIAYEITCGVSSRVPRIYE